LGQVTTISKDNMVSSYHGLC